MRCVCALLKTAKILDINPPPMMLGRADDVIE
jgi:hypothetical protein